MRGPAHGEKSHALRGPGTAAARSARLLRRLPRRRGGGHPQPARPRQPVHERRLPGRNRLSGHGVFAIVRAPTGMQRLRRALHSHPEGAVAVGQGVPKRRGTALRAGGISGALQPALDRPAPGLPHASPGAPATPCARSRCMNTLNSLSKKSGAKHEPIGPTIAVHESWVFSTIGTIFYVQLLAYMKVVVVNPLLVRFGLWNARN